MMTSRVTFEHESTAITKESKINRGWKSDEE
jgi:hypothetical protein